MLCQAIASLGMQFGPLVIDARHFLPQSRARVFVVAVDSRIDCSGFTQESSSDSAPWFTKAVSEAHERLSAGLRERWRWWEYVGAFSLSNYHRARCRGRPNRS